MTKLQELQSRVLELETENEQLKKQLAAATTNTKAVRQSKALSQAQAVLALLREGPVTATQLKAINEKYPTDAIYHARKILGLVIRTNKIAGQPTTYELVEEVAAAGASDAPNS